MVGCYGAKVFVCVKESCAIYVQFCIQLPTPYCRALCPWCSCHIIGHTSDGEALPPFSLRRRSNEFLSILGCSCILEVYGMVIEVVERPHGLKLFNCWH